MYTKKDFSHLLGTPGFSDTILQNHFALYEGYVKNTNNLMEKLGLIADESSFGSPEYNELKRRFGWEYNGMYLHELYFSNMKNGGVALDSMGELAAAIVDRFGSLEGWTADFKATGAMRGVGWAMLIKTVDGRLENVWVNEHDGGHFVGATPILVMDVFEHAFMLDYGIKRADYIMAFWNAIDWSVAESRYES